VTTDDFPATGVAEFDLTGRTFIEFIPLQIAYSVEIQIGFKKNQQRHPRCLDFTQMRPQSLANPYQRLGIEIQTLDGSLKSTPYNEIITTSVTGHATSTMLLGALTLIKTDEKVDVIDIRLISPKKAVVHALDSAAKKIFGKLSIEVGSQVQHYRLEGNGLHDARISLDGSAYLLAVCVDSAALRQITELSVKGFAGDNQVAQVIVAGAEGDVVTASLTCDIIDKVRISGGFASLINLCWTNAVRDAQSGWRPVNDVKQPIALPVLHPDYPASGNLPTDLPISRTLALSRIRYGDPNVWRTPFVDIHEECLNLVKGGSAIPMNSPSRAVTFPAVVDPGDTSTPPGLAQQQPLQLLLLASMHAPIAQMLGLYWSDATAIQGETYDYLIVADHTGAAGHDALKVLDLIQSQGFVDLDGYIVFGKQVEPATPLAPPTDLRSYALPSATRPDLSGGFIDSSCNAGFRWNLPLVNNVLLPESPVLYHLWRFKYGSTEPSNQADSSKFEAIDPDDPLLIVENMVSITGVQRPQDWPPFPLFGFDNALFEGWYGYRLSNIDILGRHSELGQAARWFEWSPTPDPKPWYYVDPAGDTSVHPFAIGLLDKMAPPPPTGVEAFALDPADPFLQKDAAYRAWFASLSPVEQVSVIGLRVRWNWTEALMRQAPDTKEFRVYYQSGRLNSRLGRTTSVSAASATESLVQSDIPNSNPVDAFAGCSLKIGTSMFTIVASDSASPLRIRVKNIGPLKDVVPGDHADCEVNIPNDHPLFVDYGTAHSWEERYYVVDFNEHVIVGVDDEGRPLRKYEVFLPTSGDTFRGGLALNPDLAEPIKLAAIGVSTADNRTHTADDAKWAAGRFGGRTGNEGPMSPPSIVFRVLRTIPVPPIPPPDSERVYATPADYHAASFYTFRWRPQAYLKTHVYRAMDDTIFNVDWSFQPRAAIDSNDLAVFPSEAVEPRWNRANRQRIADELNVLSTFPKTNAGKMQARSYYRGLSNDGLRILANLPNNETAFAQVTISALDPDDPATVNRVGPDNPPNFVVDSSLRIYVDTLDGRSINRFFYKACYIDGAQNRSPLSLASPPVWLPNVTPPRTPMFTKALGGDRQIILRWTSNRESDLVEYRVYRTDREDSARDLRMMTLVHTETVPAGDPLERPAEGTWIDTPVPGRMTLYYRLVAVDDAGNASDSSQLLMTRAFDDSRPAPPTWSTPIPWTSGGIQLRWTSPSTDLRCLVQRHIAGAITWENASSWLPRGVYTYNDQNRLLGLDYVYRLRVMDTAGRTNNAYTELTV